MESQGDESDHNNSVVDNLVSMFGHIMTRPAITTLVETFAGDLNLCVDAIAEITNNGNMIPESDVQPSTSQNNKSRTPQHTPASMSHARTPQSTGAVPRKNKKPIHQYFWTDQIRKIITHHNNGSRIIIIMRGLPGSGKSHLSKLLLESLVGPSLTNYKNHIFCTDDYFMVRGQYQYDKSNLPYAHSWNQNRVRNSAARGLSPIIVDNTNIETWEMRPYVIDGVNNGYIVEVLEPKTPWAKNPKQLCKTNVHNVPLYIIKRMSDNYVENVTGESLIHSFGLNYPVNMTPPVRRSIPPIAIENKSNRRPNSPRIQLQQSPMHSKQNYNQCNVQPESTGDFGQEREMETLTENVLVQQKDKTEFNTITDVINDLSEEERIMQKNVLEAQKRLEELQKFEEDWERGEKWDESDTAEGGSNIAKPGNELLINTPVRTIGLSDATTSSPINVTSALISTLESKPPREKSVKGSDCEITDNSLMQSATDCPDWRYISLFMPPWNPPGEEQAIASSEDNIVEKNDSSTCVEITDTNLSGTHKIITATSRDINVSYVPPQREKIPDRRMLDKSTMTNDGIVMTIQCPQKERHFIAFRNLFKHIERDSLRYIFDNCCGDANWAVENVLGEGAEYKVKNNESSELSDSEEEEPVEGSDLPCTCLAEYEIIPNVTNSEVLSSVPNDKAEERPTDESVPQIEKKKRAIVVSKENMQLKKQIEQNVVIADNHYSEHCLKIRKIRRGEYDKVDNISEQPSTSGASDSTAVLDVSNHEATNVDSSDDEDDSCSTSENNRVVNIDVGSTFIKELDNLFGRKDMEYPDNMNYSISIPIHLLNAINALWMESMMFQLDENEKRCAMMVKQDEEFAKQLQLKEQELMLQGKQPDVPDFKEIMDLEFALNLHMQDTAEWRKNIPNDIAAKMTHEKLFNLFPEVKQDTLLEMLMAHDNNFKATVEVLLISLGHAEILESEDGLNRFVMEKELQRQERILAEEKKALLKTDSSLQKDEKIDMSTVQQYRDNAEKHLIRRNIQMQKAEEYIKRGMIQVANYCSELANFHKTQYENANSSAVATLIQYHARNNPNGDTVDLHYFRVNEAKEAMDLFIDTHIQRLHETGKRSVMLFFITGRGLHSPGRPKVKPACIKRLRERGLTHTECNPGLLRSRVNNDSKLTYQLP